MRPKIDSGNMLKIIAALALTAAALAIFVPASEAQGVKYRSFNRPLTAAEKRWVERTLSALSLEEKIGQMVAADANAVFMNRESAEYRRLERQITHSRVGTLILFRSDVWATAMIVNRLQQLARVPLLVSADLEMGPGMRFNDTPWWAPNMAVAATGETDLARRQGAMTAIQARAIGINWLYAPVADVNNNPENPVINTRSYGEDPQTVASFVSAFINGAQEAGAIATAKHFPGHGDTATDSHIGLPVVNVNRRRLDEIELVPFRAAVAEGVGSIMSAHIALPQIEPEMAPPVRQLGEREREAAEFLSRTESESGRVTLPGTLSEKVMTGMLREDLKFAGLVVTDAMSMAGVAARFDAGSSAVRAVKAGADIVLKSPDVEASIAALKAAVARGEIDRARIDLSVRRVLEAKARLSLHLRRTVAIDEVDRVVSSPESLQVAQEIADRSMTLVRDHGRILPLDLKAGARLLHLTITDDEERNILAPFIGELRRRNLSVENLSFDSRTRAGEAEVRALAARLQAADLVILSLAVRARSGKGTVALPGIGEGVVREALGSGRPLIAISFGNPYLLQALPQLPAYLVAYSAFPVSQRAAARALTGEIEIRGRLPVSLPGLYPRGQGLRVARRL